MEQDCPVTNMTLWVNVSMKWSCNAYTLRAVFMKSYLWFTQDYKLFFSAAEVTLSSLTLASRTATTLSVTWSASYPKCYSITVSHSTQDGFVNVPQPTDSDTSTLWPPSNPAPLTGLKCRLWRIEMEQMDRGQRSWRVLLLNVCERMFITEHMRFFLVW